MAAQRPRPSILSLFDPLSSSSRSCSSPDSDKENDSSEPSFFHPPGFQNQIHSPMHILRRRLIDVGDITVDEPDIRDLLEDEKELEAEINQCVAIDEDENATLTFRDMAKAATPKWSARRNDRREAPRSMSTPRTPLADIVLKDDDTPTMGRKKMLRRQVVPLASKAAQVDPSFENNFASPLRNLVNLSANTPMANLPPKIEISCDESRTTTTSPSCSSGSSQRTLRTPELATPGTLINASCIPVLISPSTPPSSSPSTINISPQPTESRLHPHSQSNDTNRLSVDLQASFQLHLQSSETTFDLLNDKISFFGSTSGLDASLEERDPLFDDDEDFDTSKSESVRNAIRDQQEMVIVQKSAEVSETKDSVQDHAVEEPRILKVEPHFIDTQDQTPTLPEERGVPEGKSIAETRRQVPESVPHSPVVFACESVGKNFSTPSASPSAILYPPRPVPALKIVKRCRAADQQKAGLTDIPVSGGSRRSSIVVPRLRAGRQPSEDKSPIMTSNGIKKREQATNLIAKTNGGGPQRVIVSDGPKVLIAKAQSGSAQAKPVPSVDGPRRVRAPSRSNLAVKYATVGSAAAAAAASSIPKPISRAGSRIPAPPRQRFGVQTETGGPSKGLGRRTT